MKARCSAVDVDAVPTLGMTSAKPSIPSEKGQLVLSSVHNWLPKLWWVIDILTLLDFCDSVFKNFCEGLVRINRTQKNGAGELIAKSGFRSNYSAHRMARYDGATG